MKWFDIPQNEEGWFELRAGKVTGSKFHVFMANDPDAFGEPAKRYAVQKAIERITGRRISEGGMNNEHLVRGHAEEPIARELYQDRFFVDVLPGGLFDCGDYADSPDGLVGDDGVIEIKSVTAPIHYATLKRASFDPTYCWQLAAHIDCTGRDWVDFVSYCSEFPEERQLFVYRITRDMFKDEIKRLQERRAKFLEYIKTIEDDIRNYEY